jgi:hypothetical protein
MTSTQTNAVRKLQKEYEELVRRLTNYRTFQELEQIEKALEKNETEQKLLSNKHPRPATPRGEKKRSLFRAIMGWD